MKKLILPCIMMFILLACSKASSSDDSKKEASDGKQASSSDEKMNISFSFWKDEVKDVTLNPDKDKMLKFIYDKFNITLEPKWVSWADSEEKIKLWEAADELPDFWGNEYFNKSSYFRWIKEDMVRPLPDDLTKYPNIKKVVEQDDVRPAAIDGKFYFFPRKHANDEFDRASSVRGFFVRKDWLEKGHFKMPETIKELETILDYFTNGDPDGNGKKDTYGIAPARGGTLPAHIVYGLYNDYAINELLGGDWVKKDGMWIPFIMDADGMKKVLDIAQNIINKYADPDYFLLKGEEGYDRISQGKDGIVGSQVDAIRFEKLKRIWDKFNPGKPMEDYIEIVDSYPLKKEGADKRDLYRDGTWWSETYFNSKISDAKMDRILRLYDFLLSDEGRLLFRYGLEGIDYKKEGGKIVDIREKDTDGKRKPLEDSYPSVGLWTNIACWGLDITEYIDDFINREKYGDKLFQMSLDYNKKMRAEGKLHNTNFIGFFYATPLWNQMDPSLTDGLKINKALKAQGMTASEYWAKEVKAVYEKPQVQETLKAIQEVFKQHGM